MARGQATESGYGLRVVLIDGRAERRELIRHLVASTGLVEAEIAEAANATDALALLHGGDRDLAIVEIQMPVSQGLETITALRARSSGLRIVVCSFHRDPATKALAFARGADTYLVKPVSSLSLKAVFRELFPALSSGSEGQREADPGPEPAVAGSAWPSRRPG